MPSKRAESKAKAASNRGAFYSAKLTLAESPEEVSRIKYDRLAAILKRVPAARADKAWDQLSSVLDQLAAAHEM